VPDLTTSAIDQSFDEIDGTISVADHVLGRAHESVRRSRGSASSTMVAVPRFQVVEATDARPGCQLLSSRTTRAECRTREAADRVHRGAGSGAVSYDLLGRIRQASLSLAALVSGRDPDASLFGDHDRHARPDRPCAACERRDGGATTPRVGQPMW